MTPPIEVLQLDAAALRALADGDLAAADRSSPVPLTPYLVGEECRRVWEIRAVQVVEDPASAVWITGIVWNRRAGSRSAGPATTDPPTGTGWWRSGTRSTRSTGVRDTRGRR